MKAHKRTRSLPRDRPVGPDIEAAVPFPSVVRSQCLRCGGFMVSDCCLDLDEVQGDWCWILRCLQCGDIVDPVILVRRILGRTRAETDRHREPDSAHGTATNS